VSWPAPNRKQASRVSRSIVGAVPVARLDQLAHHVAARIGLAIEQVTAKAVVQPGQRVGLDLVRGVAVHLRRRQADQRDELRVLFLGNA
jgi:hypothetical protein